MLVVLVATENQGNEDHQENTVLPSHHRSGRELGFPVDSLTGFKFFFCHIKGAFSIQKTEHRIPYFFENASKTRAYK